MSVRESDRIREHLDALQKEVTELKDSADQASRESSEQVRARLGQVKADITAHRESVNEKANQADAGSTQSQWQSIKANAAARIRDLQERINRKHDKLDVKVAKYEANTAEDNAVHALDFAWWAVEEAEMAVLDAIDARAWADEQAAGSRTN